MLLGREILFAASQSPCQQGVSSFFENLNFLVLGMPGQKIARAQKPTPCEKPPPNFITGARCLVPRLLI
jgi:hypothetical protein